MSFEHQDKQSDHSAEPESPAPAARSVARKAVSLSLGESFASSPIGGQLGAGGEHGAHGAEHDAHGAEHGAHDKRSAVATAEDGFRGAPRELPYRAELESSFGVSFAGVKAYTDEHARRATARLGAKAYAVGNRIAFAMPNPDKALVAHELTHVLQHTGRAGKHAGGGGGDGIDTSGEADAERVEAAVGAHGSAREALHGAHDAKHGHGEHGAKHGPGEHGAAHGERAAGEGGAEHGDAGHAHDEGEQEHDPAQDGEAQATPALARRPALAKSQFGAGMAFSPYGFEKASTYTLWSKKPPIRIPIGPVLGLNLIVDPSVQVRVAAGVDLRKKGVKAGFGVQGGVGIGLGYGLGDLAEVYAKAGATVAGSFVFERAKKANTWSFDGGFSLTTDLSVGVKLGGVLDTKFVLGKLVVGTLSKLHWANDGFHPEGLGWQWGGELMTFFGHLDSAIKRAKQIANLPKDAAKKAWKELGGTLHGLGSLISHIHIDLNPFN